ncbi:hypothetical protein CL620_00145 [archaeon]|nr:hypothetical protein [archaeon]
MKIPNVFIAGAPKSGTTSLYNLLVQHPDVFTPTEREPNYFCQDVNNSVNTFQKVRFYNKWFYYNHTTSYKKYLQLYEKWKTEKVGLDGSSGRYLYSKEAAAKIAKANPDAKIIIMIREPIAFLRSLHSHFVSHFSEHITDFSTALDAEEDRKLGKKISPGSKCPAQQYYDDMARFSEQIIRFQQHFPPEQIKIILLDDFKNDMQSVYNDLLLFLELETFTPEFTVKNKNKVIKSKRMAKLLVSFPYAWKACKKILPNSLYQKIKGKIIEVKQREAIDHALRERLLYKYKGEVMALSQIMQRDLVRMWGYDKI